MLTNLHDAFIGQSRSPNIVPFHISAIVTLSLRVAVFMIFYFEKCRDLEIGVRGHSWSSNELSFDRACMVSC